MLKKTYFMNENIDELWNAPFMDDAGMIKVNLENVMNYFVHRRTNS
ncbi:hypothetical protein ACNF40_03900 [Cuniculiplasma sp. SKW4]